MRDTAYYERKAAFWNNVTKKLMVVELGLVAILIARVAYLVIASG